ncbi:PT domain-containing protein [Rothia nasimurium]|uniref:PT domain-containing protein n=1 Tax=Rothia nasimurium TaxID=85336 RepID=UPI001F3F0C37|nr:PT domain-containing protein [Rothia nasimurium]
MPAINKQSLMVGALVAGAACLPGVMLSHSNSAGAAPLVLATGTISPSATEIATEDPTGQPTDEPTGEPSGDASDQPTVDPSAEPTEEPTGEPTIDPSAGPSSEPSAQPTEVPTPEPSPAPTGEPTSEPSEEPSAGTTNDPTPEPTAEASSEPTPEPTADPSDPGVEPEVPQPTAEPTEAPPPEPEPSPEPTPEPDPTVYPESLPDPQPTVAPTDPGQGGGVQPTAPSEDSQIDGAGAAYQDPTHPAAPTRQATSQPNPSADSPVAAPNQQLPSETSTGSSDRPASQRGNELAGVVAAAESPETGDSESNERDRTQATQSSLGRLAESQQTFDGTPEWVEGFLNASNQTRLSDNSVNSNQAAGVLGAEEQEADGQLAGQGNVFQRGLAIMGGVKPLMIFTSLAVIGLGIVFTHFMWRSRSNKM